MSQDATILDEKLASYVFFPVSHLLRRQDQYPVRVVETVVRLLSGLIQYGWKAKISQDLSQQLLVFFSFTIGGAPGQTKKRELPEETILEGYRALDTLVTTMAGSSALPAASPLSDKIIPPLGHSVTVMLDGVAAGVPPLIQLEALRCLQTVFTVIRETAVLAQFLPGTVSTLSKILSTPLQQKTQKRVLISALAALRVVLTNTIGDIKVRSLLKQIESGKVPQITPATATDSDDGDETRLRIDLTPSWLKATTAQVKIALSSVLKLRTHEAGDVQSALDKLCIGLLDECHSSLAECQGILVESAMMLEDEETVRSTVETSLQDLVSIYPELGENIKSALYGWVTGLPRVMQSNDERVKQLAVRNFIRGSKHAASLHLDSATLGDSLGDALRDSVVALMRSSKASKITDDTGSGMVIAESAGTVGFGVGMEAFNPVLLELEGQKATRAEITTLVSNISSPTQKVKLTANMLGYVQDSDGADRIASYWLAFELLKSSYAQHSALDDFLDFSSLAETKGQEQIFQELYDFSASLLASHSDTVETDWRLEAIALEVTAFAASRLKTDFRPELVDVLYPVATFLGSQTPQLRSHAITTLNIVAAACGYDSVSELIVDNADYMVNSVSLRLNTFDISPASTKVLTMLIHLTGPKLIPFLDDVVAAIFAALDNYHGYPVFVESLFSVLSEIVSQGVKSDSLLLEDTASQAANHKKRALRGAGIAGILGTLEKRAERIQRAVEEEADDVVQGHPKEPWGPEKSEAKSLLDKLQDPEAEDSDNEASAAVEAAKPDPTPTYTILSRVLTLTQHYLTSPTPNLRKSLLDLVATVSPALAPDENTFLPLVNAVWPVIITRLHDPEPFVAIAACKALSALCRAAGDFLATRFQTEWSSGLMKWLVMARDAATKARGGPVRQKAAAAPRVYGQTSLLHGSGGESSKILIPGRQADSEGLAFRPPAPSSLGESPSAGLGRFSQASQIWDAAVELLAAIVSHVRMDDAMFDDILGLLADVIPRDDSVREALEAVNADAVWLALYERGLAEWRATPVMEGMAFASFEGQTSGGRSTAVVGV